MPSHHPTSNMLMEHAAGTQNWILSLAVSAHLQMCNVCRHQIHHLNHIGGALLEAAPANVPDPMALPHLMNRIESLEAAKRKAELAQKAETGNRIDALAATVVDFTHNQALPKDLPKIIRKLLPAHQSLRWKRTSPGQELAALDHCDFGQVALARVSRGNPLRDRYRRDSEIILVLDGTFSDTKGLYSSGDFVVRKPGQPAGMVTLHQDCLYLTVSLRVTEEPKAPGRLQTLVQSFRKSLAGSPA